MAIRKSAFLSLVATLVVVLVATTFLAIPTRQMAKGTKTSSKMVKRIDVGDRIRTVTLPPEIMCPVPGVGAHVAISVAVVPRSALGIPGDRALLATSCRSAAGSTIYFIDPGPPDTSVTDFPGTVVHTIQTKVGGVAFAPPNGWGAFAFRGDVSPPDMLAGSNPATDAEPHSIYSINLRTGDAFKLFDAAMPTPGKPYFDGLAWDPANDTIYMSPDVSDTIFHYSPPNSRGPAQLIKTIPVPSGCFIPGFSGNSGIAVVGPNLFLACNGEATIFEISQRDGSVVRTFSSGAERAEDMECDRFTFGPDLSVAWTKDAFQPRFIAFETPPGSCGLCRSEQRIDIADLSDTEQANLASLLKEYLTGEIINIHNINFGLWHTPSKLLFPAHRGYIGGFEIWLLNVIGPSDPRFSSKFVPLPKWNPANPIPEAFKDIDPDCPGSCLPLVNTNIAMPLPTSFRLPNLCDYTNVEELRAGGGGRPGIEGAYHGGVHISVGGTMATGVSSGAVIFWPWHAFIDDVGLQYESACRGSVPACFDLFTPFITSSLAPFMANGSGARGFTHTTAPLGYWWWFEDFVTPPELSPPFVVDHSGFRLEGRMQGGAKLVPGLIGQSLQLDGQDDFVEVSDQTVGEVGSSDFTIDAWIKTSSIGIQSIVDKRNSASIGYALFLKDGQLNLYLGTNRKQSVFAASASNLADGKWHHVAAIVNRQRADASALMIDGEIALQFDATNLAGDANSQTQLWIGRSRVLQDGRLPHFKGELDEIDLFRSALTRDYVASIYVAANAGKHGALGNLPTPAGRPACLVELGGMIAAVPEAASLSPLYNQIIGALSQGNEGFARPKLNELRNKAFELAGGEATFMNMGLHVIHGQASACLQQRDLQAGAGLPSSKTFDVCLQDDRSGNTLSFNSNTGDYVFIECGHNGFSLSGKGKIVRAGCSTTLSSAQVSATIDRCVIAPQNRGSAIIKSNPVGGWFYITDSTTADNTCACH